MKITKKIKICGLLFTVESRNREKEDGTCNMGTIDIALQKIWIDNTCHID